MKLVLVKLLKAFGVKVSKFGVNGTLPKDKVV